jgi:hypothetical protein
MEPDGPVGAQGPSGPPPPEVAWQPGIPSLREHLPSLIFGAALPIGAYFLVRPHVAGDTQALIVAGGFSVVWILIQFARRRTVDVVGAAVLAGFAIGVITSTVFGGNDYMLKVRDGFFTLLFGIACIVTLYTHDRPAFFYVSRYLSAGKDPAKVSAFDKLHDLPVGRHTFRTLSVVWGVGLVVEATTRLTLADVLPTGTFIALSPFITASVIGGLFAFTAVYTKRTQFWSASLMGRIVHDGATTEADRATAEAGLGGADDGTTAEGGEAGSTGATGATTTSPPAV